MSFAERPGWAIALLAGIVCLTSLTFGRGAAQQSQGLPGVGSLSGRVLDETSGQPIGKAAVSVSRYWSPAERASGVAEFSDAVRAIANQAGGGDAALAALLRVDPGLIATLETASDGTFVFTGLKPRDYRLAVAKDHHFPQNYGERVAGGRGTLIAVHAGENVTGVEFRITKASVIAGTVRAGDGSPMAMVAIQAHRKTAAGIFLGAEDQGRSLTDEGGRYRLEDLARGDYYVRATPPNPQLAGSGSRGAPLGPIGPTGPPRGPRPSPAPGAPVEIYVPEFYPGTNDPTLAGAVHVPAATEVKGIDVTLRRITTALVSGVVRPPENASAVESHRGAGGTFVASVALVPIGPDAERPGPNSVIEADANGAFQFNDVMPGTYKVVVGGWAEKRKLTAIKEVRVQAGSRETVTLTLRRGFELTGRLIVGNPTPGFSMGTARLILTPVEPFPNMSAIYIGSSLAELGANGEFVIRDLIPEVRYRIGGNSLGGYLLAARYGDIDASTPIVYEKGAKRLVVEIESTYGRVEVTVMDQDKPLKNILTLLAGSGHDGPYISAVSDDQGRVVFSNVRPGNYELLALEDGMRDMWLGRGFWDEFGGLGHPVRVEKGVTAAEKIPMIKLERGLK